MAVRWSSENVVAEHRDLQANAMALDWRGEYTLLAGRRMLALISLDRPSEVVKKVNRTQQKYDVTAAEWNPIQAQGHTFVLASGERAEMCQWREGSLTGLALLRAHHRTITDLNWHRFDPHLLATCSIDTFVHIWDTREPRKPVASLTSITGASQVKWNKLNQHMLASGHDCDVRVWDNRKPSQPIQYIAAHISKIQGLDWSPNHENQLVTSSNDCTVKFFDVTNPRKAENYINTMSPVWRARYTPFGEGVVTVVVPQLRRGENSLLLWSVTDMSSPVHTFVGHSDVVLEFEWQPNTHNPGEHHLVTWARDHSLRIWNIDQQLLRVCGHDSTEEETILGLSSEHDFAAEGISSQGDSEHEVEKVVEAKSSDLEKTEEIRVSAMDTEGRDTNILKSHGETQGSTEELEEVSQENSPETGSTTETSEVAATTAPEAESSTPHVQSSSEPATLPRPEPHPSSGVSGSSRTGGGAAVPPSFSPAGQPMSLQQEFSLLNTSLDNSQVNSVEVVTEIDKRLCQVTAKHRSHTVCLTISFPISYPRQHSPSFRFTYGTTIDPACKAELSKVLKSTANQFQRKKKACLEPCIRVFVSQLKALLGDERLNTAEAQVNSGYPGQMYGSFQDHSVPFPRTSGARFSSAGFLVCFARPTFMKKGSSRLESSTPRSLSALGAYISNFMPQMSGTVPTSPNYNYMYPTPSPSTEQSISISNYYYQDKKVKNKRGKSEDDGGRSLKAGGVLIYDVQSLMPLSKDLGASYVLDENDVVGTCTRNREAAAAVGRKDLVQFWSLAATTASLGPGLNTSASEYSDAPWTHHPFGRKLISSILDHCLAQHDVQTATMLSCVFGNKSEPQNPIYQRKSRQESSSTGGSPYNTIHGLSLEGCDTFMIRHNRSNSEGSLSEASRPSQDIEFPATEAADALHKNTSKFLDSSRLQQFDQMKRAYADILYRWGYLEQHAMVLKYIQVQPPAHKGVEFYTECIHCGSSTKGPQCLYCWRFSFNCSICHIAVKGASNFCVVCGHGGHSYHLLQWFKDHNKCPTGCGCDCVAEMDHLFR